jgi:IS30 family transposase
MSASRSRATAESILQTHIHHGSDFGRLTGEAVNQVAARINLRPRKRLGWNTPYEVYTRVSVALVCWIQGRNLQRHGAAVERLTEE